MKISLGSNKMLLNPGSVGQPRNGKCNASWLRLNVNTMKFSHMETKYDKTRIKKQISIYDSNNMLLLKYFNKCK
jgi:predicted phosphodiesterase